MSGGGGGGGGGGVEGMLVVGALLVLDFFRRWEFC